MNIKKRGLGKGLSDLGLGALLGDLKVEPTSVAAVDVVTQDVIPAEPIVDAVKGESAATDGQLKKLPIDILKPGKYQPRKHIAPEALEELANSIRSQGIIQPVVVRPIENNQYEIIAGERRWRAAQLAGLTYIPAIIRDINDHATMLMALIENIQRRDLNVVEEASALSRLMTEFKLTHQEVADAVGKSRTNVTNTLRLLNLSPTVRRLLEDGQLEMGHARALLTLDENQQSDVAAIIVAKNLSVRETEDLVRKMGGKATPDNVGASQKMVLHSLQDQLSAYFSVGVSVTQNAKGAGKLVISYKDEDELNRVLSKITEM